MVAGTSLRIRPIAAVVFVAGLAVQILRMGVSDYLVNSHPEQAVRWDSANTVGYVELSQLDIARKKFDAAFAWGQRALQSSPIAPSVLSVVATAALAKGQIAQGDALMRIAAKALREPVAGFWLFTNGLRTGDYEGAMSRADALLRQPLPTIHAQVLPLLARLVSLQAGRAAIANAMSRRPPWAATLVAYLSSNVGNSDDLIALSAALRSKGTPFDGTESRPMEDRLLRDGKIAAAFADFRATFPVNEQLANLLSNGDFARKPMGSVFDWTLSPIAGASIILSNERRDLSVVFFGGRVPFRNVTHMLALKPGRYTFNGQVQVEQLEAERRLQWKIACLSNQVLATAPLPTGTTSWQSFTANFSVPDEPSCEGQSLVLELPARVALEQEIRGRLSFKDLSIRSP